MNKKVLTLCAGFLLAGGVNAFAQNSSVKMLSLSQADPNQYYIVNVNNGGKATADNANMDAENSTGYSAEVGHSTHWRVEKVSQDVNGNAVVNGYRLINEKTGKALVAKVDGKTYDVVTTSTANGKMLLNFKAGSANNYLTGLSLANGVLTATTVTDNTSAWGYGLEVAPANVMDGAELNDILGDRFAVQIGYQEDKNENSAFDANEWFAYGAYEGGNVFEGDIYVDEDATTTGYALYKDAEHTKQIVLTTNKWQETSANLVEGYIFKVMDASKVEAAKDILATSFLITAPSTVAGEPIEIVAIDNEGAKHEVVVSVVKKADGTKVNRLTVGEDTNVGAADYTATVADQTNNTYVKFGAGNVADPTKVLTKNTFYTITEIAEDGNFLFAANACGKQAADKADWVEGVANKLEGQWALSYADGQYTVTNREDKGITFTVAEGRVREDDNTADNVYIVDGKTVKIEAVETAENDGYKWLGDVVNQHFGIAHWSNVYDDAAWVTADAKGNAILKTGDVKEVATELKVVNAVDTIYVAHAFNYFDKEWKVAKDTLKVPVYAFADLEGNDFKVDAKKKNYVFDETAKAVAQLLTIRENEDKYNLRLASKNSKETDAKEAFSFADNLIDAGDSKEGLLENKACIYDTNDGQSFVVEQLNRPVYRRLGATVEDGLKDMDVNNLKFYRTNDENTYLYENSANRNANNGKAILNFLGETNLADQPANSSLAIFVDTAYVRNNTMEPLYLLSVRNTFVEGKDSVPCPDHGYDPNCPHWVAGTPDYREGAYLVGLADSTDIAQVKYQGNTRLAFVDAKHMGDSLIIENSKYTGTKLAANDTLSFVGAKGVQVENAATFSFRLVDPADSKGDFYIETVNNQYVRVHNSVPVLVTDLDQAATFNVNETEDQATANEEINAEGNVVVAGVDGAVVVKGAEGKNVIVSTILGKVVANEVLNSDNAQIVAPAGIVVVSVDGESFKVVVK